MSADFFEDVAPGPNSGLIEVLSYRTYPSLVSALREVVSNASDADATKLNISLSRTYDQQLDKEVWKLTFFDDGEGMTLEEFRNYLRLSGLGRRDRTSSDATPSGRPIIGMLGIGSLAIAPWADRVEILTKKRGSSQVLHVQIPYGKFFNNPAIRSSDLYGATGEYKYSHRTFELQNPEASEVENGFSFIDLIGLTDEAINELVDPVWQGEWDTTDLGLLGEKYHEYLTSTKQRGRLSFRKFPPLLRFMHRLALLIPVPYPAFTPVQTPPIRTMVSVLSAQCMDAITVQGVKLQRPMVILDQQTEEDKARRLGLPTRATSPSSSNQPRHQGTVTTINETLPNSNVQIRGYIWGQNTQIKFQDLAGIQVRIKNVGIGSYNFALFDPVQELDSRSSTRASRAQAISGEIFIDYSKELERALRGDREGFQESSPVYIELKTAVYKHVQRMYQKIDALAPSRQNASATSSTANTTPNVAISQMGTAQESAEQPAAEQPAAEQITTEAKAGEESFSTRGDSNPPSASNTQTADVGGTTTSNSCATAEKAMPSQPNMDVPPGEVDRKRSYVVPRNVQPSFNVDYTEVARAELSEDQIVVTIIDGVIPTGLESTSVDQICTVAAALAVAKIARENQIPLTEIGATLALNSAERKN